MSRLNAWVLALLILGVATPARAREYESFVEIDNEDDLYSLVEENTIDQDGFDTLKEILETGVDLATASRNELYDLPNLTYPVIDAILAYREEAGGLDNPASLVSAGLLSERELMALAPFLLVSISEGGPTFGSKGWARYSTVTVAGENRVPGMVLQVRGQVLGGFRAGAAAMLTRDRVGRVRYDFDRRGLTAFTPTPRLQLAKAFAKWDDENYGVIVGTYKIGFGQSLTFDNTGDFSPNGFKKDDVVYRGSDLTVACRESTGELSESPCKGEKGGVRVTPDYRWIPRLLGVAGGARRIDLGVGHLQAYGFASYQRRAIYQYDVLDRTVCSPEDEANDACNLSSDFNVYVTQDDPSASAPEFKFTTLSGLYDELVLGGNVAYWFGERARIGLTGYGANPFWRIPEMDLDFRQASRWPSGGPFGAVGIDAQVGFAWWDLGMEITRSIDTSVLGGGDFGAIVRGTGSWKKRELELSLRYYGPKFQNPFARPISAADEREGLRARDEAGARVRYTGKVVRDLELRGTADVWANPSTGEVSTRNELRFTYMFSDAIRLGAWGLLQDNDLVVSGRKQCFETFAGVRDASLRPDGSPLEGCAGMKMQTTAQVRYMPFKKSSITLQYQHSFLDDSAYSDRFRQDRSFWVILLVKPMDGLRLRARLRYLMEDIADNAHLETWVWSYLEVTYDLMKRFKIRARYDLVAWLDKRDSTAMRSPDPENWFWLTLEAKF